MDPLYVALKLFELRKYHQVDKITTALLDKNPQDEALWALKMRALTLQVYVDEYEMEYEDVVDQLMDESAMAAKPRPGTSLRQPGKTGMPARPGATARPISRRTGRPVSGMLRPASRTTTANRNTLQGQTGRGIQTSYSKYDPLIQRFMCIISWSSFCLPIWRWFSVHHRTCRNRIRRRILFLKFSA